MRFRSRRWHLSIEWGQSLKYPTVYAWHFCADWRWGEAWFWVYDRTFYDQPIAILHLGPLAFSWATRWTKEPKK